MRRSGEPKEMRGRGLIGHKPRPPVVKKIEVPEDSPLPATVPVPHDVHMREGKVANLSGALSGTTAIITVDDFTADYGDSSTGKTRIVAAGQLQFSNGLVVQITAWAVKAKQPE